MAGTRSRTMAVVLKLSLVFLSCIGLPQAAGCPPLWTHFGGYCYRFFGQRKSWQDAEDHCRGFFTSKSQAHLASFHHSGINDLLIEMWNTSLISIEDEGDSMWIGLTDQDTEGVFIWLVGGPYSANVIRNVWLPGQPDDSGNGEDCVEIRNDFNRGRLGWNDENCDQRNVFVCKMYIGD